MIDMVGGERERERGREKGRRREMEGQGERKRKSGYRKWETCIIHEPHTTPQDALLQGVYKGRRKFNCIT